ncbi:MAG: DUF5777 family beta-barrel protein [Cyclobacteriaceae bacterium]
MKSRYNYKTIPALLLSVLLMSGTVLLNAQDSTAVVTKAAKPVKNTFESTWIIDNQSVMVPVKGTMQMDIMHRFGTVNNGYEDFYGIYAPSNIRIGMSYVPIEKLIVGFGFAKVHLTWDLTAKYALVKQMTSGGWPVSVTLFGNMAVDTRPAENFVNNTDRLSYFGQLIIARKVTDNFSVQVAPSLSHFNAVEGYLNEEGVLLGKMENDHFAISVGARYKVTPGTVIMVNYDQPLTQHTTNNPQPNIAFGVEFNTSAHAFQVFLSNYQYIIPQLNNMYNQNDYREGQFLIGFNITRLWNF